MCDDVQGYPLNPLSHYGEHLRDLGEGTTGSVYVTDKGYAIKHMKLVSGLTEVRLMGFLLPKYTNRPSLQTQYIDICLEGDDMYIVMPLAQYDLFTYLYNTPPGANYDKIHLMYQMVMSVDQLHRRGIAHYDIKPENYLIYDGGSVKLTDYNLSEDGVYPGKIILSGKYSMIYQSPEFLLTNLCDMRSDIWALGITCLELLVNVANVPLLTKKQSEDILYDIVESFGPIDVGLWPLAPQSKKWNDVYATLIGSNIAGVLRDLDPELSRLIKGMLSYNPQYRFSTEEILRSKIFDPYRKCVVVREPIEKVYPRVQKPADSKYISCRQNALVWMINIRGSDHYEWPVYGAAVSLFDNYTNSSPHRTNFTWMLCAAASCLYIASASVFQRGYVSPVCKIHLVHKTLSKVTSDELDKSISDVLRAVGCELHTSSVFNLIGEESKRRMYIAVIFSLTSMFLHENHRSIYNVITSIIDEDETVKLGSHYTNEIYQVFKRNDSNGLSVITDGVSSYFSNMFQVPP